MNPNVLLNAWKPDILDPMELYSKGMNMRALVDARKAREMQMQVTQMKLQQEQQEQAERQQAQQNLSKLPENPTLQQTIGLLGYKHGVPVWKGLQEAQEAKGKSVKEQLEAETKRQLLMANYAQRYLSLDDPAKRQEAYEIDTPDMLNLGLISREQSAAKLGNEEELWSLVSRGKGIDYTNEYRAKRTKEREESAKAALEKSKKQIELADYYFGSVTDQPSLDKWVEILPPEMRGVVRKEFNPENMKVNANMLLTAQQRQAAAQQGVANNPDEVIAAINNPQTPREEIPRLTKMLADMVKYRQEVRPVLGGQDTSGIVESVLKNPETYAGCRPIPREPSFRP